MADYIFTGLKLGLAPKATLSLSPGLFFDVIELSEKQRGEDDA